MGKLNNLPPFYIGQKVVYITGSFMSKGSIHTVKGVNQYSCGCWLIDIGTVGNNPNGTYCHKHGENYCTTSPIDYWASLSFRAYQEQKLKLISLTKVLEEVEMCEN